MNSLLRGLYRFVIRHRVILVRATLYRYDKLTPEDRDRLLRERQARGFPLHAPPHPMRSEGRYLITAANFEHKHIMFSSERRTDFETRLLQKLQEIDSTVFAWVVLPNHYQVLLGVTELDGLSSIIKELHGRTAREWNLLDALVGKAESVVSLQRSQDTE